MTPWLRSAGIDIFLPEEGTPADWLYVDWKGWHTPESVVEGCEAILQALSRSGLSKVLNDNTNGIGDWSAAADWVARDWFPDMEAAGLRWFAWVKSPSTLTRRTAVQSAAGAERPQVIWLFDDRASAEAFLASR